MTVQEKLSHKCIKDNSRCSSASSLVIGRWKIRGSQGVISKNLEACFEIVLCYGVLKVQVNTFTQQ